jgi:geranylgeranyl diphosphate synthase, type I
MSSRQREAGAETLWSLSAGIDRALRAFVDRQPVSEFYDLVRYHLGWSAQGQAPLRPRAVLCAIACQACGGSFERALPMAVAIALLHSFELNQEDLERQRRSRHGRQSVWSVWGTPQAMNAGDGMHALAKMALLEDRERLSAAAILHLQQELDESCLRCCEAIHLDQAAAAAHAISAGTLERAANKTAILFGYAAYAGCYVACAGQSSLVPCLRHFGELLGSAAGVKPLSPSRAAAFRADAIAAFKSPGIAAEHQAALRDLTDYVLDSEI